MDTFHKTLRCSKCQILLTKDDHKNELADKIVCDQCLDEINTELNIAADMFVVCEWSKIYRGEPK